MPDLPINRPDFTAPPPPPAGPTAAQIKWMQDHPNYVRTSHTPSRFMVRGTLTVDGSFISEDIHPVMDGNGAFGVGIPIVNGR